MLSRIAGILFGVAVSLLLAVIVSLPAEGPQCLIWPKPGPGLLGPAPMLKVEESNSGYMSKSTKALTALSPQSQLEAHVWNGLCTLLVDIDGCVIIVSQKSRLPFNKYVCGCGLRLIKSLLLQQCMRCLDTTNCLQYGFRFSS